MIITASQTVEAFVRGAVIVFPEGPTVFEAEAHLASY